MKEKTLTEVWTELDHWIYMHQDGGIVYDNHAQNSFEQAGGDFDTLILAIEDHIVQDDDDKEVIDWPSVETTYEHMVQQPEWTDKDWKFNPDWF
jgi:hypothetical protein